MKKNNHPSLPNELIREILLRLPVRSVLRFKCVCESWLCIIKDPQFGTSHYDLAVALSDRLLLESTRFYIESIDIEASSLRSDSARLHLLLPSPPPPSSRAHYTCNYHSACVNVGSCRGFVVLFYIDSNDLILWNPSTGHHKFLLQFGHRIPNIYLHGFGYDPSTDDYLIILVSLYKYANSEDKGKIRILSFKTGWLPPMNIKVLYWDRGYRFQCATLFNDALHWLVFSEVKELNVIIAFDLKQRSLSEIPLFAQLNMERDFIYCLRVLGGNLSVCCFVPSLSVIEIWMMKEYKVQSSWSIYTVIRGFDAGFHPICFTKDGLILGSQLKGLEKINDKGDTLDSHSYGEVKEINLQPAMYSESLLPLPSVSKNVKMMA